jgi:hypothetical protein
MEKIGKNRQKVSPKREIKKLKKIEINVIVEGFKSPEVRKKIDRFFNIYFSVF